MKFRLVNPCLLKRECMWLKMFEKISKVSSKGFKMIQLSHNGVVEEIHCDKTQ